MNADRSVDEASAMSRRSVLAGGVVVLAAPQAQAEPDDAIAKLVKRLTGKTPKPSDRVRLTMPKVFPNGYTVPLAFTVDSAMTAVDHVEHVQVLAPKNPLVEVATFRFAPGRSRARVDTRIRLAEPQTVVALARMSNGDLLMAATWVDVASDGCK